MKGCSLFWVQLTKGKKLDKVGGTIEKLNVGVVLVGLC